MVQLTASLQDEAEAARRAEFKRIGEAGQT